MQRKSTKVYCSSPNMYITLYSYLWYFFDQLVRLWLNAAESSHFPFYDAYKYWVEAKHRRYVISLTNMEDSNSESSECDD